ncbi:MAG: type VI secretion system-associated protein TagF, partial [Pseudomonadota bacterium]
MNKQGFRTDAAVGYYGKVPSHGDFVTNGLDRGFVELLDIWLQRSIQDSKAHLGSRWLDAFLVTPVWRFAFAPGVCGAAGAIGLIMPSVDRVGRYFPLVLTAQLPGPINPVVSEIFNHPWFDAAEDLAR